MIATIQHTNGATGAPDFTKGWVLVQKAPDVNGKAQTVRLSANGAILFNMNAAPLLADYVNVLYSPNLHQIAIVNSDQNDLGSFKLSSTKPSGKGKSLRPRHFYRQLGLEPSEVAGLYIPTVLDGMLIIQLPIPVSVSTEREAAK